MKANRDIYEEVTNTIIAELEAGAAPWVKPWTTGAGSCGLPYNASTRALAWRQAPEIASS